MFILQIEHPVPNFDGWKKAFDSDPLHRKQSGVTSYHIFRGLENPNYVVIQLEFDKLNDAESMQISLRQLWGKVDGTVITNPQSKIIEAVESIQY